MSEEAHDVASWLHFRTELNWIEAIRSWAQRTPDVQRVWIFGSRATGARRTKDYPAMFPDLDVAYSLRGSDQGTLLGLAICEGDAWKRELQSIIAGVTVDLQYADPEDVIVWPAAHAHGVLIYEAED